MTAFETAWNILKSNTLEKQSYHPAIHGLMNRKRIADGFNVDMESPYYQPSDFVDEAEGMGYEPKGASGPNSLRAAEQSGELKRQSTGFRQGQYPQYTPELYNALMSLQQPNDPSKAIPRD
jgi:hypothetical protein